MAKRVGVTSNKTHNRHVGVFFFGFLIGILFIVGLVGGVGAFAYFKISPKWLKDNFGVDMGLKSTEAQNMTLSEAVPKVVTLIENIDNYSLNDLKNDFGVDVGNNVLGIDITDLKSVSLSNFSDALKDKFENITLNELDEVIDVSSMGDLVDKKVKYYINAGELYKDEAYSNAVSFEYTIDSATSKVTICKLKYDIKENAGKQYIEVAVKYLPIKCAFADFTATMGNSLTIQELEDDYGVTLPAMLQNIDKTKTINELDEEINNLLVADVLEYTINGTAVEDKNGNAVTGVSKIIAKKKIGELQNLNTIVDDMSVADIFIDTTSGVFSLIDSTTAIKNIPTALKTAITTKTLGQLKNAGLIDASTNLEKDFGGTQAKDMTIQQLLNFVLAD